MKELEGLTVKDRAKEKLKRDLGSLIENALNDLKTIEIMLNADGRLWQERLGERMQCIGRITEARAESIIKTIAGFHGKEVTSLKPLLEGELPLDGSRFAGQLPPVVSRPTFAIRKKAINIFTIDDYVQSNIMTKAQAEMIKHAVSTHQNILVIGGTGSGKTTLVNAIITEMVMHAPEERLFIIEDTGEIQCLAENCVQYHTTLDVNMTQPASASSAGGGLPFDSWLTKIETSITSPFAFSAAIIGLVAAGATLIFGGELNGFMRTLIFFVLVLSFLVAAQNTMTAIPGKGAEITKPSKEFQS